MPNIQEIEEQREAEETLMREELAGQVKSKWLMNHKFNMDQAVIKSLDKKKLAIDKRRTKGLFQVNVTTNAGNWMQDREWKFKANDIYKSLEM